MKIKRSVVFIIIIFISYLYGMVTIQYQFFPYQLVKSLSIQLPNENKVRTSYYYHKKSFFEETNTTNVDIAFVGDSLTDFIDWQEFFPDISIVNRGIGGDTTGGVLERMDSILSTNAKCVFIMLGINDISKKSPVENIYSNYKKIIDVLSSHNMTVFIQSTLYVGKSKGYLNETVKILNNKLHILSYEDPLVRYIDLNHMLSPEGYLNKTYSEGGLHFNGMGYLLWKSVINEYRLPDILPVTPSNLRLHL